VAPACYATDAMAPLIWLDGCDPGQAGDHQPAAHVGGGRLRMARRTQGDRWSRSKSEPPPGAAALASKGKRPRDVDRQIARAEVALQAL